MAGIIAVEIFPQDFLGAFADAFEAVKKYFNSKMPRLVAIYLLAVTRDTVDSCIWIASATAFRFSGRRCATPRVKNPSCCRTISVATFRMVRARWSRARTSQVAFCRQSEKYDLSSFLLTV